MLLIIKLNIKIEKSIMDKQTQFKIIQLTHQRDELITRLQDLAEELTYEDVSDIVYDIAKLNKTLKKLMTNGNDEWTTKQ